MTESNEESNILVKVLEKENIEKGYVGLTDLVVKSVSLPMETVARNLQRMVNNLSKTLDEIKTEGTNFQVDSVSFNLEIESSGKVALVGEIGASSNSSICVTLKKRRENK
jgi:hypothetical protein